MQNTEPSWNKDASNELKIYKWISWPFGIWPFSSENMFSTFRTIFAATTQISMMIPLFMEICQDCTTVDVKIDNLANFFCNVICLVKIIVLKKQHKKLRINLFSAITDWSNDHCSNSYKIMKNFAHTGKKVCTGQLIFVCFALSATVLANLPFLLARIRNPNNFTIDANPLPMPLNCVYKNISLTTNKIMYAIQAIQFTWTAVGNCGTDVFFFGLAMHTCGQLEILKQNFSEFTIINDEFKIHNDLRNLIMKHLNLIKISQNLEDIFNNILIAQLLMNFFITVLAGIEVIIGIKTGNNLLIPRAFFSFIVLMVQVFLYCYAGDYLSKLNESLTDSIYESCWYNHPVIVRKDLLFIMLRSKVKFHITAGKFYVMDIENFTTIIKTYMSYMSVLIVLLKLDE